MRGLICASVNREDLVPRCSSNPEANNKVEFFNPYGWTALASIKPLHATVEDRSIMIFLTRRPYHVRLEKMRNVSPAEFHSLTQKLMRVRQDSEESVRACRYEVPDQISDRQGDKWIGPLRIAKTLFTPEVFQECLAVAERDSKESEDSTDNLLWVVLHHVREARKCGIFTENGRTLQGSDRPFEITLQSSHRQWVEDQELRQQELDRLAVEMFLRSKLKQTDR